ncbi:unnamed protein product, partial [Coregonus sp. 'balchen']
MEKMKVMGLRRQKNYAGRWDVLIQQATQCLNRLIHESRNSETAQLHSWPGSPSLCDSNRYLKEDVERCSLGRVLFPASLPEENKAAK